MAGAAVKPGDWNACDITKTRNFIFVAYDKIFRLRTAGSPELLEDNRPKPSEISDNVFLLIAGMMFWAPRQYLSKPSSSWTDLLYRKS